MVEFTFKVTHFISWTMTVNFNFLHYTISFFPFLISKVTSKWLRNVGSICFTILKTSNKFLVCYPHPLLSAKIHSRFFFTLRSSHSYLVVFSKLTIVFWLLISQNKNRPQIYKYISNRNKLNTSLKQILKSIHLKWKRWLFIQEELDLVFIIINRHWFLHSRVWCIDLLAAALLLSVLHPGTLRQYRIQLRTP